MAHVAPTNNSEDSEKNGYSSSESQEAENFDEELVSGGGSERIMQWVKMQMDNEVKPEEILQDILGENVQISTDADEVSLWEAVLELIFHPPSRDPLPHVTSLDDVIQLIRHSNNIIVLSGAGISVSCGIPDFRSPDGIYARLALEFPDLADPQAMFDISFFEVDPRPFFKFAKEIFPGKYHPSVSHKFISLLEKKGKLLRNYTQNIDTLEEAAGISKIVYCHGSFSTATCRQCKLQVPIDKIKDEIMKEEIPYCLQCLEAKDKKTKRKKDQEWEQEEEEVVGVMKPDIVFFGEGLPESFHRQLREDKTKADLLIVMGSSLKVRPVSLIPDTLPSSVPQILINREPLQYIQGFDVRLLGYSDTVVTELCKRLGGDWQDYVGVTDSEATSISSPKERVHLFDGGLWNVPNTSSEEEAGKTKRDEEKESCKEIQSGRERSWDLKELDNLVPSTKIHKPDRTCDSEI